MTNHIGILRTLKSGKEVKVKSNDIEKFKQNFEIFTGCLIEYEEMGKELFKIILIH